MDLYVFIYYNYTCEVIYVGKAYIDYRAICNRTSKGICSKKEQECFSNCRRVSENIVTNHEIGTSFSKMKSPITDSISGMFHDNGKSYKDMLSEALQDKYL